MPGNPRKIGIALSGGGAKGAFQVGVLDFLVNDKGLHFHTVAGVSTGALQAVMVAQDDVKTLRKVWESIKSEADVFRNRPGGILGGLLGADSLYDNSPLAALIRKHVDPQKLKKTGTKLRIGVVSLQTGEYRLIRETEPRLHDWILASTAIPFAFEPVEKKDEQFVDGGIRDITPLGALMDEDPDLCLVVLASPLGVAQTKKAFPNMFKIALRAIDIMTDEIFVNDVANARWVNELLDAWKEAEKKLQASSDPGTASALKPLREVLEEYRVVPTLTIAPRKTLLDTLEFDPKKIRSAIMEGRKAAQEAWPKIEQHLDA